LPCVALTRPTYLEDERAQLSDLASGLLVRVWVWVCVCEVGGRRLALAAPLVAPSLAQACELSFGRLVSGGGQISIQLNAKIMIKASRKQRQERASERETSTKANTSDDDTKTSETLRKGRACGFCAPFAHLEAASSVGPERQVGVIFA